MARLSFREQKLGEWITLAQRDGALTQTLPPEFMLYTPFARTCDPVPGLLKASGRRSDGQIIDRVLANCLEGLAARR